MPRLGSHILWPTLKDEREHLDQCWWKQPVSWNGSTGSSIIKEMPSVYSSRPGYVLFICFRLSTTPSPQPTVHDYLMFYCNNMI